MTQPIDESGAIVVGLRSSADSHAKASQYLADLKSDRNNAAGDDNASYRGLAPHETLEWRAADLITAQAAKIEALKDALRGLIQGIEPEINEKGAGGFLLARLTDARSTLKEWQK